MLNPITIGQFKRDLILCKKHKKDILKLRELMLLLIEGKSIPLKYGDQSLQGDWKYHRKSRIESDWSLIYKIIGNDLYFVRTGSHADIFGT